MRVDVRSPDGAHDAAAGAVDSELACLLLRVLWLGAGLLFAVGSAAAPLRLFAGFVWGWWARPRPIGPRLLSADLLPRLPMVEGWVEVLSCVTEVCVCVASEAVEMCRTEGRHRRSTVENNGREIRL